MNPSNDNRKVRTSNVSTEQNKLRRDHELDNPCLKEHNLTLKCLDDNNYVRDACKAYFENYKSCQFFWKQVQADRKRKNIVPYLPSPQDRTKVKNEYIKSGTIK